MEIREAFDVEHVNFIDKEDARDQLCNTLVNVLVHNLVYFLPKLVCTSQ